MIQSPTKVIFSTSRMVLSTALTANHRHDRRSGYYDATIGRFISVDPIITNVFNPQAINPYSYCLNNPLKYIDPTGEYALPGLLGVVVGLVGLAALSAYAIAALAHASGMDLGEAIGGLAEAAKASFESLYNSSVIQPSNPCTWSTELSIPNTFFPADAATPTTTTTGFPVAGTPATTATGFPSAGTPATTATGFPVAISGGLPNILQSEGEAKTEEGRPTIEDIEGDPEHWIKDPPRWEDADKKKWKGGKCLEERWTHKETGRVVERQTIFNKSGKIVHQHPRYK